MNLNLQNVVNKVMSEMNANHGEESTKTKEKDTRPKCEWSYFQREEFVKQVFESRGRIPSLLPGESTQTKWEEIQNILSSSLAFKYCQIPEWHGLMRQYKTFKIEVLRKYNFTDDTIDIGSFNPEEEIPTWEMLILNIESDRYIAISVSAVHESNKNWKKHNKYMFYVFVSLAISLCTMDFVLIGFDPHSRVAFALQIAVLVSSIFVFIVGIILNIIFFPEEHLEAKKSSWYAYYPFPHYISDVLEKFRLLINIDFCFELFCYAMGIIFLSSNQRGLAAIRTFRMYRFLSYFEYFDDPFELDDIPPEKLPFSILKAGKLFAFYMRGLYEEFATQKSLGGLLVILLFFLNTYVVAVIFKNQKGYIVTNEGASCYRLRDCFITMLRLALYDGTGFDYLSALVEDNNPGMLFILFVYMIFNAIILINGMIGIFGDTFTTSDEQVDSIIGKIDNLEQRLDNLTNLVERLVDKNASTTPRGNQNDPSIGDENVTLRSI